MDLGGGSTIPISSLFTKIEGKRGKVCNALVTFINLTVVNDHGSSDEISSVDLLLILTLLPRNLKRVIPPRTGLLRLAPFKSFFQVLGKPFQGGNLCKRSIPGLSWRQIRGNNFPRTGWKPNLVQSRHN
jgi:hypothetical protein